MVTVVSKEECERASSGFFADLVSRFRAGDVAVADRAAGLRAGAKALQMPDALIVAGAELELQVDLLLTGDRVAKLKGLDCSVDLLSP